MGSYSFIHPQSGINRHFRRASENQLCRIVEHAHARREAHTLSGTLSAALERLRTANQFFLNTDFGQRSVWLAMPLILAVVCVIDIGLFRPLAEYLAGRMIPFDSWRFPISLFVPPAILGVDVGLGLMRHYYAELENRGWLRFWTVIGVLLALVMPLGAAATQLAAFHNSEDKTVTSMHFIMFIVLGILSLVSHTLVVFSGRPLFESKAYWLFRWNEFRGQQKLNSATRAFGNHGRTMGHYFGQYLRDLNNWNNQNPESRMEAGPFDVVTREELRDFFGYEAVQLPPSPGPPIVPSAGGTPRNAPPAASAPSPPNIAGSAAENRPPGDPDLPSSSAPAGSSGGQGDPQSADREKYLRAQEAAVTP